MTISGNFLLRGTIWTLGGYGASTVLRFATSCRLGAMLYQSPIVLYVVPATALNIILADLTSVSKSL